MNKVSTYIGLLIFSRFRAACPPGARFPGPVSAICTGLKCLVSRPLSTNYIPGTGHNMHTTGSRSQNVMRWLSGSYPPIPPVGGWGPQPGRTYPPIYGKIFLTEFSLVSTLGD